MSFKDKKNDKQIHELEEQIEKLTAENQELLDKLQRLSADYTNYQKRVPRQVADSVAYEKKNIVRSLLPSLDNFDHAFTGFNAAHNDEASQNIIKGVRLIFDHMLDALKAIGLDKVSSVGRLFDPSRHEAMMQRTEPDKENGIVLEEYLPCYLLGGEVLRPAKVIVNKLPQETRPQPEIAESSQAQDNDETTDIEPEVQ
jgi:molecular chaperone GrpE